MSEILHNFFLEYIQCKSIYSMSHKCGRFMHTTFKEEGSLVTGTIDSVERKLHIGRGFDF